MAISGAGDLDFGHQPTAAVSFSFSTFAGEPFAVSRASVESGMLGPVSADWSRVTMSTRCASLVGVILLGSLITGCGSSSSNDNGAFNPSGQRVEDAAPSTTPAASVPSTMTTQQIDQAVLDRYREYQKAYKTAYERNDPSGLSAVAMDPLLSIITKDVEATAAKGEIWRFTVVTNPKIQARSKDSQTIFVLDCLKTLGAYRYSAQTGKRLGEHKGGAFTYQVIMKYSGDDWKISESKWGKKC